MLIRYVQRRRLSSDDESTEQFVHLINVGEATLLEALCSCIGGNINKTVLESCERGSMHV